ncbi:MAG: VOC family protein [Acidimicrobiales bacterium]
MLKAKITAFIVADVPSTVEFYERVFGLELAYMHPSREYAELASGEAVLAFIGETFVATTQLIGDVAYVPNRSDAPTLGAHVALWSDDIDADWERALASGASVAAPLSDKPWGQTSGYVRDPNGIVVELCTPSVRAAPSSSVSGTQRHRRTSRRLRPGRRMNETRGPHRTAFELRREF